jgi:hypothetical protein
MVHALLTVEGPDVSDFCPLFAKLAGDLVSEHGVFGP